MFTFILILKCRNEKRDLEKLNGGLRLTPAAPLSRSPSSKWGKNSIVACPTVPSTTSLYGVDVFPFPSHGEPLSSPQPNGHSQPHTLSLRRPSSLPLLSCPPLSPPPLVVAHPRCWRKISTSRQAHSKPNKAGLTHVAESEACQSIFLKLTNDEK
jgi:hypothetical protein